jgi:hypothetical protein
MPTREVDFLALLVEKKAARQAALEQVEIVLGGIDARILSTI